MPAEGVRLLSHCSIHNKCLLLLNTTAISNSSSAYSQRRIALQAMQQASLDCASSNPAAVLHQGALCVAVSVGGDEPSYIQHAQPFTCNWLVYEPHAFTCSNSAPNERDLYNHLFIIRQIIFVTEIQYVF